MHAAQRVIRHRKFLKYSWIVLGMIGYVMIFHEQWVLNSLKVSKLQTFLNFRDTIEDYDYYEQFYQVIKTEKYHTTLPMTTMKESNIFEGNIFRN